MKIMNLILLGAILLIPANVQAQNSVNQAAGVGSGSGLNGQTGMNSVTKANKPAGGTTVVTPSGAVIENGNEDVPSTYVDYKEALKLGQQQQQAVAQQAPKSLAELAKEAQAKKAAEQQKKPALQVQYDSNGNLVVTKPKEK